MGLGYCAFLSQCPKISKKDEAPPSQHRHRGVPLEIYNHLHGSASDWLEQGLQESYLQTHEGVDRETSKMLYQMCMDPLY